MSCQCLFQPAEGGRESGASLFRGVTQEVLLSFLPHAIVLDHLATLSSNSGDFITKKEEIMDTSPSHNPQPVFSCYTAYKSCEQRGCCLFAFALVDNRSHLEVLSKI